MKQYRLRFLEWHRFWRGMTDLDGPPVEAEEATKCGACGHVNVGFCDKCGFDKES